MIIPQSHYIIQVWPMALMKQTSSSYNHIAVGCILHLIIYIYMCVIYNIFLVQPWPFSCYFHIFHHTQRLLPRQLTELSWSPWSSWLLERHAPALWIHRLCSLGWRVAAQAHFVNGSEKWLVMVLHPLEKCGLV